MNDKELMQKTYAAPLHEQLASVPENARLVIDDPDGMGTRFIPVGRLCREAAAALRERLAQPEQKPGAWRNAALRVGEDLCSVNPFGYYDMTAQQWLDWALSVVTVHNPQPEQQHEAWCASLVELLLSNPPRPAPCNCKTKLNEPQPRQWQGLTGEEVGALTVFDGLHHVEVPVLADFIRAIEAKLKEKNGG